MLRLFAENCTLVLLKNGVIQDNQKKIYIYGFELFWSTSFCVISILSLGVLFGYLHSAFTFLIFFMPIRMVAGGYHAKSYGACFWLTNGIALLCIFISKWLWYIDKSWVLFLLVVIMLFSFFYIWKKAPVNLGKHSTDICRIQKNRKYSHFVIIVEIALIFVMRVLFNSSVSYTAITATCAVALMVNAAIREGVKS